MKNEKKKAPVKSSSGNSSLRWLILAFVGLTLLVGVQYLWQANLCEEGVEIPAEVVAVSSTVSENHDYGRSLKIYNVELGYTVAGNPVSVIKTFNDGEVGGLFAKGAAVGDTVLILVDEDEPKRFVLRSECE